MALVAEAVVAGARQDLACAVIALSSCTLQRWQRDRSRARRQLLWPVDVNYPGRWKRGTVGLAFGVGFGFAVQLKRLERERLLAVLNSTEFGHLPPSQIVTRLADRGQYIASESTMNRVLKAENRLKHRGTERAAQKRHKPTAFCATAPAPLFSWDITYLPTPIKGLYFYLYLFMDIFSRKIVGWQVYEAESSELAGDVMRDICMREDIPPNQIVLYSDNGICAM